MANIVKATLIKTESDDGLFEMHGHIKVGKEYLIDLDTKRMADGRNGVKGVNWRKEIVEIRSESGGFDGWMPTEMLEWEGKKKADLSLEDVPIPG